MATPLKITRKDLGQVTHEQDLRKAIRALARAAGHDELRKHIIDRANALKLAGLVPDNWEQDGSLKEPRDAWATLEERDTANDVFSALDGALDDQLGNEYSSWYFWVQDWYGDGSDENPYTVIYYCAGDLFAAPFTVDDTGKYIIGVGDAVKVRQITSYVERAKPSPMLDWRKQKAEQLRGLERREFKLTQVEIREKDDDTWTLTGYASVTDTPYEVGFYTETIKRGAFTRTLGENPDVQLLVNHEGLPLARTRSGTLRLEERDRGLWVEADLDKLDIDAQRLQRKMARGDIDQMSFAFQVTAQEWNDDYSERTIKSVSIHRGDVSVVNQGANPATSASIRSAQALDALRRFGAEGLLAALIEWRAHTLLALEERAGKTLSASTMEVLNRVLELVASADESVDEAQPLLAELMGVPNPDDDEDEDETAGEDEDEERSVSSVVIPDYTSRAEQEMFALRNRKAA